MESNQVIHLSLNIAGIVGATISIIGTLVAITWLLQGRFTKLETSMDWVKEALHDLKLASDNMAQKVFATKSPVTLTPVGDEWLTGSGMKKFVDDHKSEFVKASEEKKETNPYEIQKHIFKLFDDYKFDATIEDQLKKFAFEKGTTMNMVRRIGAIYFRDMCLGEFGKSKDEIDLHDPEKAKPKQS